MTWVEAQVTLQLEAEERIGFVMRAEAALARAREDAKMAAIASLS